MMGNLDKDKTLPTKKIVRAYRGSTTLGKIGNTEKKSQEKMKPVALQDG